MKKNDARDELLFGEGVLTAILCGEMGDDEQDSDVDADDEDEEG